MGLDQIRKSKIVETNEMSTARTIDGFMISSSDVRSNVKNETNVIYRLKTQIKML